MTLMCLLGYHKWSEPRWRWTQPDVSFYWYERCVRCGKRHDLNRHDRPPVHFVRTKYNTLKEVLNDPKGSK